MAFVRVPLIPRQPTCHSLIAQHTAVELRAPIYPLLVYLPLSATTSNIYRHRHAQSSEREIYQAIHSNEETSSVMSECSKENITPM